MNIERSDRSTIDELMSIKDKLGFEVQTQRDRAERAEADAESIRNALIGTMQTLNELKETHKPPAMNGTTYQLLCRRLEAAKKALRSFDKKER